MVENSLDPDVALTSALADLNLPNRIGVAVSGGGDSMALLALARDRVRDSHRTLTVATVDHGLRENSRAEAEFVARICAQWNLPHEILSLSGLQGSGNLPSRARDARYDALSGWAHRNCIGTVLLGHTMDDQAETVLMRLARGSGVEGLSGIPSELVWNGVRYTRPLLKARRDALRDWLRRRDIEWIEDPTNEDSRYYRVKAREALGLLGSLGITTEGLAVTADRLTRQRKVLETAAEQLADTAVRFDNGIAFLDRDAFRGTVSDTAMRVLAQVLQQIGGNRYRPRFRALEPLYERIVSDEETTVTLSHCLIALLADQVRISPEQPVSDAETARIV